jgi:hypothetical protein
MSSYPPAIRATAPCPVCGGIVVVRRCKIAHRKKFCCGDCDYRAPLPTALTLRLAGWQELPLFEQEETHV